MIARKESYLNRGRDSSSDLVNNHSDFRPNIIEIINNNSDQVIIHTSTNQNPKSASLPSCTGGETLDDIEKDYGSTYTVPDNIIPEYCPGYIHRPNVYMRQCFQN